MATAAAAPKRVKNLPGAFRIIARVGKEKTPRVVHVQGDDMCLYSKLGYYKHQYPEVQFSILNPHEPIPTPQKAA